MATARDLYSRAGWTIAFALILYYVNYREYPGPAATLAGVIVLIGLAFIGAGYFVQWINTVGQARVREQLLDALKLTGEERVLEAGCGTGALSLALAKRLKGGKLISIGDASTNEAARESARAAGIVDRVRFESSALDKLTYPNANFDVVVTSRALDGLGTDGERQQAVAEMVRVLKPGGRLAIHCVGAADVCAEALRSLTKTDIQVDPTGLPLGLGGRIISARVPS